MELRFRGLLVLLACALGGVGSSSLAAQESLGALLIRARRADSAPVEGAFIRSGSITGVTDAGGVARVLLPATLQAVVVSRAGYEDERFEITIVGNATQRVDIILSPTSRRGDSAFVSSARATRRLRDEPVAIRLFNSDVLAEEAASHPADLAQLLNSGSMIRSQTLSGPLDANEIRLAGLRGRYTGLLLDGLPLFGGRPDGYALMQSSPLAYSQAEVITGAAAALYGSSGPAGVVNLISPRPDRDAARASVNQSSEKGADFAFWGARRQSPTLSATLYADFHQQRLVDEDDDGWGEFPRALRFSVRPQLFLDAPNGSGLVATAGATSEDRTGGLLLSTFDPNPYREERRTRKVDGGLTWQQPIGSRGRLTVRAAGMYQFTSQRFGAVREREDRNTEMGEVAYTRRVKDMDVVAGAGFQRDVLRDRDVPEIDYTFTVPSVFGQITAPLSSKAVLSASGRCDFHNVYGTFCTPRLSALIRPSADFTARVNAGASYYAPIALIEETQTINLSNIIAGPLNSERIQTASATATWTRGQVDLETTVAASRVTNPVRLKALGDAAQHFFLTNGAEPVRTVAAEARATWRHRSIVGTGWYGYIYSTEQDPNGPGRRETELTPRHSAGADLGWRSEGAGATVVKVAVTFTGPQSVWDNPNRTRTPGYAFARVFVSQRAGRARLYASGENMFDAKLANYEAIQLAVVGLGGRRTAAPWVPVRGRMLSLGALVEW